MAKLKKNAEYLAMLDRGYADIAQGKGITKTMEELRSIQGGSDSPMLCIVTCFIKAKKMV